MIYVPQDLPLVRHLRIILIVFRHVDTTVTSLQCLFIQCVPSVEVTVTVMNTRTANANVISDTINIKRQMDVLNVRYHNG